MNITAVAIVAICAWAIVELSQGSKKRLKIKQENNEEMDALRTEISEMKERIQTLEKIVTDEKFTLNQQFSDLEKDKVA